MQNYVKDTSAKCARLQNDKERLMLLFKERTAILEKEKDDAIMDNEIKNDELSNLR